MFHVHVLHVVSGWLLRLFLRGAGGKWRDHRQAGGEDRAGESEQEFGTLFGDSRLADIHDGTSLMQGDGIVTSL